MTAKVKPTGSPDKRIVVLQAGWVFIGNYYPAYGAKPAYLTEAHNIRIWGTTAGLGEIALKGPTSNTVLDPVGIVLLDTPAAILFTIPCET